MTGRVLEILPFGLLPLLFFFGAIVWYRASDSVEKHLASEVRSGLTEFPHDMSWVLNQWDVEDLLFSEDGRSVVVTIDRAQQRGITDEASAKMTFLGPVWHGDKDEVDSDLIGRHVISSVRFDPAHDIAKIVITLPDDVVHSRSYIEREIGNVGRVFSRNLTNGVRWLQCPQGDRLVEHKDGRVVVHIERSQVVPGFLETKLITMSERQITRNIKNRLWNRVEVLCTGIDDKTYHGEILLD